MTDKILKTVVIVIAIIAGAYILPRIGCQMKFKDDPIVEIGSYWNNSIELNIYAKTKSGKVVAGSCKYTNAKIKKSELTKLQENCQKANIEADIFVIFSKRGFSSELKALKGENLKLFTVKNFKKLVE